jgi:hypothetical protein|tara:strand:- start:24 stop:569 length:546 start_codon:yes stop_codon:yes gene_type:complete
MALTYKRSLLANTGPILSNVIIDQSDTITLGDVVKVRNGNLEVATAGDAVFGVVHDIVDKNGDSVFGSLAVLGSATISGGNTVAVASDNETVDLIAAKVDCSQYSLYSAKQDGTMGTTTASDKIGGWADLTDETQIDESTHTRTITTGGTFTTWGEDPVDTTRILVSINESEILGPCKALA